MASRERSVDTLRQTMAEKLQNLSKPTRLESRVDAQDIEELRFKSRERLLNEKRFGRGDEGGERSRNDGGELSTLGRGGRNDGEELSTTSNHLNDPTRSISDTLQLPPNQREAQVASVEEAQPRVNVLPPQLSLSSSLPPPAPYPSKSSARMYPTEDRSSVQPLQIEIVPYTEMMHFKHVMRIVEACTSYDANSYSVRRWAGLRTFLKYYFASMLQLFAGNNAVIRVFLVTTDSDIGAKLYTVEGNRYVLSLAANFEYWDRLGGIAAALPNIYFKSPSSSSSEQGRGNGNGEPRRRLSASIVKKYSSGVQAESKNTKGHSVVSTDAGAATAAAATSAVFYLNDQAIPIRNDGEIRQQEKTNSNTSLNDQDDETDEIEARNTAVMDRASMALCMVHLFEIFMHRDLKNKIPNYVTLAKLFTHNAHSINPFTIKLRSR